MDRLYSLHSHISPRGSADQHAAAFPSLPAIITQTPSQQFTTMKNHDSHPDFLNLAGLVSEAVMEVVFVAALGFIAARKGHFSGEAQKTVANLNIFFFTPCLIFSKLAKQLSSEKLIELWIIPVILFVQTIVSWVSAKVLCRIFGIRKKPQSNFITAMAVFGNSNSLPLSLVLSLSHTISGLHWDKIPGDNDDEVAARGILYLLIFSQLGQAVRWSWGMNTLLKPLDKYSQKDLGAVEDDEMAHPFRPYTDVSPSGSRRESGDDSDLTATEAQIITDETGPVNDATAETDANHRLANSHATLGSSATAGSTIQGSEDERIEHSKTGFEGWRLRTERRIRGLIKKYYTTTRNNASVAAHKAFQSLPQPLQKVLTQIWWAISKTVSTIASFLNVPLCAIIVSVIVGSVPAIKAFFYTPGSFVNNTFTSAVEQLGGVAVPLILFVLGGNLNKSTLPSEDTDDPAYSSDKKKMLFCSLMSRMLIPLVMMAPVLAVIAKYVPISILDDPIFIIVCFLLTGAPSALQLAQICQVNNVYVPVIAKLLVHSYVIWIFPSTLILVMIALEVVEWAQ